VRARRLELIEAARNRTATTVRVARLRRHHVKLLREIHPRLDRFELGFTADRIEQAVNFQLLE